MEELKAHQAKVKAYFVDQSLNGNIICFGESLAKRVKPSETLSPVVQQMMEEDAASLVEREDTLSDAENITQEALSAYSTMHADVLVALASYRAQKAALDQQTIDGVIAYTVARASIEGNSGDEN